MSDLIIPGYQILSDIGEGAMAKVYLALQERLDRQVAIKVISMDLAGSEMYIKRFMREAQIVAKLSHPNIVAIHDVGEVAGQYYLVMEYHQGGDLKQKIRKGLSLSQSLSITKQIASALDSAHRKGVVHRDIKPANILFDSDGRAVLTDFGVARIDSVSSVLTTVGTILGTPKYMSPEQAQGFKVDGRSDLYCLGVLLYEMLVGQAPYEAQDPIAICSMHVTQPIPILPPNFSKIQNLLDACMAKDVEERVTSGHEIVTMIDELENHPNIDFGTDSSRQPQNLKQSQKTVEMSKPRKASVSKNRMLMKTLVLFVVTGIVIFGALQWSDTPNNVIAKIKDNSLEAGSTTKSTKIKSTTIVNSKPSSTVKLIRQLQIIAPKSKSICQTKSPFLFGERILAADDMLDADACFAIKVKAIARIELLVYVHSQDGTIRRLVPNTCRAMNLKSTQFGPKESIHLPNSENDTIGAIGLDNKPGRERVYAIAIGDKKLLDQIVKKLPDADVCDEYSKNVSIGEMQSKLKALQKQYPKQFQWLESSFLHST